MKVLLSAASRRHLRHIYEYIRQQSPQNAALVRDRIFDFLKLLETSPLLGKPGRVEGTREFLVPRTSMLVIYRLGEREVEVVAMIHKARQWSSLPK